MQYAVVAGDLWLKDYGPGWSRWTDTPEGAMKWTSRRYAHHTAFELEGKVVPVEAEGAEAVEQDGEVGETAAPAGSQA